MRLLSAFVVAAGLAIHPVVTSTQTATRIETGVDRIFARWTASTPGCAVGVAKNGARPLARGYGLADLEHDVRNQPDTIFEAGSVSKQFTAAAVLLLAREGKLSLDDPARKYIPELPDYGTPLTIRHMLTHTSGLRDWGSVAAIGGWPRTRRVHTHAHVLDIVSRQRSLNFTPGTEWSYSNTGYNLAAIIVSRVSGVSFADFTRTRIFEPLGMKSTSWRDDYTRIVKRRAIAYAQDADGFRQEMPFENVHGNGGLLTTVGDLLTWNENFQSPRIGGAAFVEEQQTPGRLSDGRGHDYALGLRIGLYKGVREVSHGGATAGYRAFLTRFPDEGVSVVVLCNLSTANATQYAQAVADLYLGDRGRRAEANQIRPAVAASAAPREQAAAFRPRPERLADLVGTYVSDEAETEMSVAIESGAVVLKQRPDRAIKLSPLSEDTFSGQLGRVIFRRNDTGRPTAFSIVQERVWDLRFTRR